MAKGLRSKVKKKYKAQKRAVVSVTIERQRLNKIKQLNEKVSTGENIENICVKNAFLYPDDTNAEFPQKEQIVHQDFRSHVVCDFLKSNEV